ncbi:MAG: 30S ribosomal protein S16 [Nocardioidaceae bacterium]
MAVKIRLKRMGKVRQPYFRVVVVDSRKKRDGKVIEQIGKYHPKQEPSFIEVTSERAQYWLGVGAQPSEAVAALLKITGDWQKFKGLPGTEGTLRVAEPKRDKAEIFNEALKESAHEPSAEAVTKTATAKKAAKKAEPAEPSPSEQTPVPSEEAPVASVPSGETPQGAAEAVETTEAGEAADTKPANTEPVEGAGSDAKTETKAEDKTETTKSEA